MTGRLPGAAIASRTRLLAAAVLFGLAGFVGLSGGVAPPAVAADRALLVGIDDYSMSHFLTADGRSGRVGDLRGAVNDVRAMRELLESGFGVDPEAIRELTDRAATRQAVIEAFDELVRESEPGDRVFVHYSGHGVQIRDEGDDESDDGLDEALVLADADCLVGAHGGSVPEQCSGVLLDDEIGEQLERLEDRHVLVLIDSCHSGTVTRSAFGDIGGTRLATFVAPDQPERTHSMTEVSDPLAGARAIGVLERVGRLVEPGERRVVLTAVAPHQLAVEVPDESGRVVGLFSDRLTAGLLERAADENGDDEVSFAELTSYLRSESDRYCASPGRHATCLRGIIPQGEIPATLQSRDVFAFGRTDVSSDDAMLTGEEFSAALPARNPANLDVTIHPRAALREGELMTLDISADETGLLMVFDRTVDGRLVRLYPPPTGDTLRADGRPLGWVRGGAPVTVPDDYAGFVLEMEPPYGEGTIVAVLAEEVETFAPWLEHFEPSSRAFTPIARPEAWLGELYATLETLVPTADADVPLRAPVWSVATVDYQVSP